jgi:DNA-binding winged helix-turn-helix (wHTH) protein
LDLLLVLGRPVGQVVGKDELMQCVWPDVVVGGSLTQSIADIRRALGDVDHRLVCNVARRGYQFVPDGAAAQPAERMSATSAIAGTARRQASSAWAARDSPLGLTRRHGRTTPSSRATRCHAVPALSIIVLPLTSQRTAFGRR